MIIGHAHVFSLEYVGNIRQMWDILKSNEHFSEIIFNSTLSVDSFLLISAAVLSYKVHCQIIHQRQHQCKRTALSPWKWLILWFHRFIRLLPAYLIAFLIIYFIFQHFGNGPMWSQRKGLCVCFFSFLFFHSINLLWKNCYNYWNISSSDLN